jgi:uncharacterized protein (DUF427 family)
LVKLPGPDHPISIAAQPGRVTVRYGGRVVAETVRALRLEEAGYRPVFYIPAEDADWSLLRPTDHRTHCPYKGDADHHSLVLPDGGHVSENAVWRYARPYPAVAAIAGHLAFYASRVEAIEAGEA